MTIDEIRAWAAEIARLSELWNPWSPILAFDHPSGLRVLPRPPRVDSSWNVNVRGFPIAIETKRLVWALGAIDRMTEDLDEGAIADVRREGNCGIVVPHMRPIPPSFDVLFHCMPAQSFEEFEAWYRSVAPRQ